MFISPGQLSPETQVNQPYFLKEEIPILMYHEIGKPSGPWKELYVEPAVFENQLDWLKNNGYTTVLMKDVYAHWYDKKPLPEKPIVLTFDDGYRNMYEKVLPLLSSRDMKATFFLYPSKFNTTSGLTRDMVAELAQKGMEIGSHTYNHRDLTQLPLNQLKQELLASKNTLEQLIKKPVDFLCYPAGRYNPQVITEVEKTGYKGAVTTKYGQASYRQSKYKLKRIRINYSDNLENFIRKIK